MDRKSWLKWRQGGLGSSDAPVIMGVSPWRTLLQLYDDKIAPEPEESSNYITDLGNEMEPRIRSLIGLHMDDEFEPENCELAEFPFLRASLDGRSKKDPKRFIEIKLSGKEDWENTKLRGIIPEKYTPQIQHQLMVSGCHLAIYASYLFERGVKQAALDINKLAVVVTGADKAYIATLFAKEFEFWHSHVIPRKPPEPSDKDYAPLTGLKKEIDEFRRLNLQIKELEILRDAFRDDILKRAEGEGHRRYLCAGLKIVKQIRQGNVKYTDIPELKNVDLDKYRGKGSEFWTIK
jgi:putative phage-type endonuclease